MLGLPIPNQVLIGIGRLDARALVPYGVNYEGCTTTGAFGQHSHLGELSHLELALIAFCAIEHECRPIAFGLGLGYEAVPWSNAVTWWNVMG